MKTTTRSCLPAGSQDQCGTTDGDTTTSCCDGDFCNDDEFADNGSLDETCDDLCNCDCTCQDCDTCCTECCNQDLTGMA